MPLARRTARPVAVCGLDGAAAAVAVLVTGCGAHGQPDALEACKAYTNATTGVVDRHDREAGLAEAERWAAKAADKGAQWQQLLQALRSYHAAVQTSGSDRATADRRLADARALINGSCQAAAKGY